jgi:hypothetical protein
MSEKTPGQVLMDAVLNNLYEWNLNEVEVAKRYDGYAAAVIAHVIPKIAESARTAAIDDVFKIIEDDREELPRETCDKIAAIGTSPPGHVCVQVNLLQRVRQMLHYHTPEDEANSVGRLVAELDEMLAALAKLND